MRLVRAGSLRFVGLLALAIMAAAAGRAGANAGKPWGGGVRAGELGGIEGVAIAREELVIDLRPLVTEGELATVRATYHLDNRGDARRLDLVFATGSAAVGFRVLLDGRPVAITHMPDAVLPESWRPPGGTPGLGGGELGYQLDRVPPPEGFQLDVPPGRHELAISYGGDPMRYHRGEPTILYQLAYVLSPARTWAGFGGLDVTVHVPPGWRAAVEPALAREGDTLRGTFAAIPADALGITVQAPAGAAYSIAKVATNALLVLVLLGGGFVVVLWTRASERRRLLKPASVFAALVRGLVWGTAVAVVGALAIDAPDRLLPAAQVDHRGFKHLPAILGVMLATVAACVIGAIASYVAARRVHADPALMPELGPEPGPAPGPEPDR